MTYYKEYWTTIMTPVIHGEVCVDCGKEAEGKRMSKEGIWVRSCSPCAHARVWATAQY